MLNENMIHSTRKEFLTASVRIGMGGFANLFGEEKKMDVKRTGVKRVHKTAPGNTIRIAGIGLGGSRGGNARGLTDVRTAANIPGTKIVALCDLCGLHLDEVAKEFGADVAKYRDFREVLDRKDVDAVVIGTPDHWHVLIAITAMNAGKHVYCEKPLTLTIDEGKKLVNVWRKSGCSFQAGSQLRADPRYRLLVELVRSGRLGKISKVEAHMPYGPTGGPYDAEEAPSDFDFEMWLGPRPKADYNAKRCFGSYRYFMDYSGGNMTDFGAHMNDIAQWGLGYDRSGPIEVEGEIVKFPFDNYDPYKKAWTDSRIYNKAVALPSDHNNWFDTIPLFRVTYTYQNGVKLITSNTDGDYGITFFGVEGWISVSLNDIKASDTKLLAEPLPMIMGYPAFPINKGGNYLLQDNQIHMSDFLDAIRTGGKTSCDAEIAHRSATVCHLGTLSMLLGRKLQWDPKKEEFVHDSEANHYLRRPMRKPWTIG